MQRILHNKAQCLNCKDIIESTHVHDWVCCTCYKQELQKIANDESYRQQHGIFIDGGQDYLRRGHAVAKEFLDLTEYEDVV